ncbi:MAG: glycosyltransferase [Oscillospiraceae bacterium]
MTSAHKSDDIRIFRKECVSLAKNGFEVFLVATGESYEKDGVHIVGACERSEKRLKRMTQTARKVFKKALEIDADVYHFHDPELLPFAKKLKKRGKKVIYDSHEDVPRQIMAKEWIPYFLRKPVSNMTEKYENSVARELDYIVCATPFIRDRYKQITYNAIDINNFPALDDIMYQTEDYFQRENILCYAGGLTHARGITQIVSAMEKIDGKFIYAGSIGEDYKKTLDKLDKDNKTEYLGFVDRDGVNNLYKRALVGDCVLLPTPNHMNSLPIKMFEYMGAGLPFICSDFPLWKSIINESKSGICVNPNDADAIAQAVNFLFCNKEKAKEMGDRGRQWVENKYNWSFEEKKLVDIYKSLV